MLFVLDSETVRLSKLVKKNYGHAKFWWIRLNDA